MGDLTQEIAKYKIYSSLDLKSSYHQIPMKEENKPYTAFEVNGKLYQFCRIPFGVTNGVSCFQSIVDKIIKENNLTDVYANVDNSVIVGKNQIFFIYTKWITVFISKSTTFIWCFYIHYC